MKTIIITEAALNLACHPDFPIDEILGEAPPKRFGRTIITIGRRAILISTQECGIDSRLLVIGQDANEFFEKVPVAERRGVLDRCIRIALRSFDKSIALNPNWMPFRQDNRVSLFAFGWSSLRIIAETCYEGTRNTYVFGLLESGQAMDLGQLTPDATIYGAALAEFPSLLSQRVENAGGPAANIELDYLTSTPISKGLSYDSWFSRLSPRQRDFVERPLVGPLRVRGAAGTGKTLAMVMKALRLAKEASPTPKKILFLTHSWAMAVQVDEMFRQIGRDISNASSIEVYPLLELSRQRDYSAIGRSPLGLDSEEGKRQSLRIIGEILNKFRIGDWIAYRGGCTPSFVSAIESAVESNAGQTLTWDLLVEFGCVIAAQGLLRRGSDRDRYLRIRRVSYMMQLANQTEREVVFRLWGDFLHHLTETGFISSDQMISDYLNDLQTFYWEAARAKRGWDYVFVDEMHLFNAQERLIFHNLLKDADRMPLVVMALDPRQSPREVFTDVKSDRDGLQPSNIYERARLPNPDKVEFVEVYRYTPEIAALIKSVVDAVPALDMDEDWNLPAGVSVGASGPTPSYLVVADEINSYRVAIKLGKELNIDARKQDGQVAILCLDYDRFNKYYIAAENQHAKEVFVIRSRDDVDKLRYMNRRIVFSTPEYVAGLQFHTVILLDVNENLVPDSGYRGHLERHFLSELYLGMSRAEKRLLIVAARDGDGLSSYLDLPKVQKLLIPEKADA